ncbi:MAG: T9SS type A sorting domain-containing protein, partial [Flavisolibacter sp.]
ANCTFKLYNSFGQELKITVSTSAGVSVINKTNLPKGLYYLQINSSGDQMAYNFANF